jgi:hypothetical protein
MHHIINGAGVKKSTSPEYPYLYSHLSVVVLGKGTRLCQGLRRGKSAIVETMADKEG